MPGRIVLAAATSLLVAGVGGAAWAATQDYAYSCPPLDAATITVSATAPATVPPNGTFTIADGVISGSVELGQFAGFIADGTQADVTAAIIVGAEGDANPDGSVTVTVTLTKSGTTATFSQPLPPIELVAGPSAASGVGISPGTAQVSAGGAGATCTRTGSEGPFATFEIAGEPAGPPPSTTTTTAAAPAAGPQTGSTGGGAVLADSGVESRVLLLAGGGAVLAVLATRRLLASSRAAR